MKRKIVKKLLAGMLVASMCVSQIPYGAIDGVSVVYGAEYLVNGDFSSDIESDWNVEAGSDRFELASDEWDTTNSTQALKFSEAEMVNSKSYKVDEDGSLDLSIKNKSTYELVSKEEAKAIEKQIKATIKVQNSSKDVKKGKTTKVTFDKKMNMNNVKSITFNSG